MEKEFDRIVGERLTQLLAVGRTDGGGGASRGTGKMLCGSWVGGEEGDQGRSSGRGSRALSPDGLQAAELAWGVGVGGGDRRQKG